MWRGSKQGQYAGAVIWGSAERQCGGAALRGISCPAWQPAPAANGPDLFSRLFPPLSSQPTHVASSSNLYLPLTTSPHSSRLMWYVFHFCRVVPAHLVFVPLLQGNTSVTSQALGAEAAGPLAPVPPLEGQRLGDCLTEVPPQSSFLTYRDEEVIEVCPLQWHLPMMHFTAAA